MRIQTKIVGALCFASALTLAGSLFSYGQVRRLSQALYEVGVVRLPSIEGLEQMRDATAELSAVARALASGESAVSVDEELQREQRAWHRFDAGWRRYEPLPQTTEEAALWAELVPLAKRWRAEHAGIVTELADAFRRADSAALADGRSRLARSMRTLADPCSVLLGQITRLNFELAEQAKQGSVRSGDDVARTDAVMLAVGLASVGLAAGLGILLAQRIARPIAAVAGAIQQVAEGDRTTRVKVDSTDEIGTMQRALNVMVENLRTSEAQLRLVADNLPNTMLYQVLMDTGGRMRFVHVSEGVRTLHGVTPEAVLRDSAVLYDQVDERDRADIMKARCASLATMEVFKVVVRVNLPSGAVRWREFLSRPRRMADGLMAWDGMETDITERKRSEAEMQRANRALRTLSRCNHVLVHATSEDEFLRDLCQVIVQYGGYRLAWVGWAEQDEAKTVRPVAHAGVEEGYLANAAITWADTPRGQGPTGLAIRTGKAAMCRNFEVDPNVAPWREEALRRGYVSSAVLPLRDAESVFGALSIYSGDAEAFDAREFELLQELADDLAFGIQTLRDRQRREEAEAGVRRYLHEAEAARAALQVNYDALSRTQSALRESETRYRRAMHQSAIGMALIDLSGRWIEVNPVLCALVGYTAEELEGTDAYHVTHPEDRSDRLFRRSPGPGAGDTYVREKRYVHKSGALLWVRVHVSLVRDEAGNPLHYISQIQDVTQLKLAQKSLNEAAERLALALRASNLGIWRYNRKTREMEWDARMFAIFGLPPAARAPSVESILAMAAGEDQARVRQLWEKPGRGARAQHLRVRILLRGWRA